MQRNRPTKQSMIRQADVFNANVWLRQVVSGHDNVQQTTTIVCGRRHTTGNAMVTENFDEVHGCRIVRTVEPDIDVTHNVDWVDERDNAIKHVSELIEES